MEKGERRNITSWIHGYRCAFQKSKSKKKRERRSGPKRKTHQSKGRGKKIKRGVLGGGKKASDDWKKGTGVGEKKLDPCKKKKG